jgi:hypothetical protein
VISGKHGNLTKYFVYKDFECFIKPQIFNIFVAKKHSEIDKIMNLKRISVFPQCSYLGVKIDNSKSL